MLSVGVNVGVCDGVSVAVAVGVLLAVGVSVIVGVLLAVGVIDAVSVIDGVGVIVGVRVGGAGSQALLSAINTQNKSVVRCFDASMAGVLWVAGS